MYYADYHIHSNFSLDCTTDMEDIIISAIKKNIKEIAFTDHIDFDYPGLNNFLIDTENYVNKIKEYNIKYRNEINILCGIEIGLQPHVKKDIKNIVDKYLFDFIIGSIHVVDKLDLYNGDFFVGKNQKNSYLRYFENVVENINVYDEFDVLGHIDYIIRYGDFEIKKLSYTDYNDIIDTILKTLINKGKGIELNTSGFRYGLNQTHPQLDILKRYKNLGGEIITVGSDSHSCNTLCSNFEEAYEILKLAGFSRITLFKNRKPIYKNI